MSQKTGIEWTDATWNPVRGCSRVSQGCKRCYAERLALRFSGPGQPCEGLVKSVDGEPRWTGKVRLITEKLGEPLKWRKPKRIFVNSMGDLFHESLSFEDIAAVYGVMAVTPHTYQVLTKRPKRALDFDLWVREVAARQPTGLEVHPRSLAWPMDLDWARDIRDQCVDAGVPFFFKQRGGTRPKQAGRLLDGRTWDEFPGVVYREWHHNKEMIETRGRIIGEG